MAASASNGFRYASLTAGRLVASASEVARNHCNRIHTYGAFPSDPSQSHGLGRQKSESEQAVVLLALLVTSLDAAEHHKHGTLAHRTVL